MHKVSCTLADFAALEPFFGAGYCPYPYAISGKAGDLQMAAFPWSDLVSVGNCLGTGALWAATPALTVCHARD